MCLCAKFEGGLCLTYCVSSYMWIILFPLSVSEWISNKQKTVLQNAALFDNRYCIGLLYHVLKHTETAAKTSSHTLQKDKIYSVKYSSLLFCTAFIWQASRRAEKAYFSKKLWFFNFFSTFIPYIFLLYNYLARFEEVCFKTYTKMPVTVVRSVH